jgi:hypothetical protein
MYSCRELHFMNTSTERFVFFFLSQTLFLTHANRYSCPCPHLLSIPSVKLPFALSFRYVVGTAITTKTELPNNAPSVCP